jgi:ATP/maltotriose-dependent transcriptional regulator MalT
MEPADALARGRASIAERAWSDAYAALSDDDASPLAAADRELLALSAYMLGRDDEWAAGLERAHHLYVRSGDTRSAVRCALWVCVDHMQRGELGPATGWLGRVNRLLDSAPDDCVERGYALIPHIFRHEAAGDWEAAAATAGEAAAIGERFGEADLVALARQAHGGILAANGEIAEGLALADEAMVTVTTEELSPIVAGLVYCGVILACRDAYDVRRAREWTAALTRWCEAQQDLVAFTGRCLVHRAEIMQLGGEWHEALAEATRAAKRLMDGFNRPAAAEAFYRQGELHRARGELAAAERSYREASRRGREPQPGLALMRLAQGRRDAAVAAIARVLAETDEPPRRAGLLAAAVEIHLAAGAVAAARHEADELERHAERSGSEQLAGTAAHARGAVELAGGDPTAALVPLRRALTTWQRLGAPYEEARSRELVGHACRALGDGDSASLELEAARAVFEELGARGDLDRLGGPTGLVHRGLSPRELEVLRLLATGRTNREIAGELVVSARTVDRHVSNIFAKLDVSSRAAATAYAYEHELV